MNRKAFTGERRGAAGREQQLRARDVAGLHPAEIKLDAARIDLKAAPRLERPAVPCGESITSEHRHIRPPRRERQMNRKNRESGMTC